MTAEQRRRTIGRWCEAGLDWRSWSVREMTAVLYRQLVQDLYDSEQHTLLRDFLSLAGDKAALGELDRHTMGQGSTIQTEPTPRLRGSNA